jgi:hypothetical protein
VVRVLHHNLGNGRCPAAATYYRYLRHNYAGLDRTTFF